MNVIDLNKPRTQRYCQTREESVIQNLLDVLGSGSPAVVTLLPYVVDLGAGDGRYLSNSQLLIEDLGWQACRIDGNCRGAQTTDPTLHEHRITSDNVSGLLTRYAVPKTPGLLCIDLDSIDFYVLHETLLRITPTIVVFEINGARDPKSCDVVAYDENLRWQGDDYYGASWSAYEWLLARHGYTCVHHHDSLNGYAVCADVARAKDLLACPLSPQRTYHKHREGPWVDATKVSLRWVRGS